jgi:hypothetical protein
VTKREPSSTVSIFRQNGDQVDLLVLGDSMIVLPDSQITDKRIDAFQLVPRSIYQGRLAAGYGYDDMHHQLLRELQTQQAQCRNTEAGYWIAEAAPEAADHAITLSRPVSAVPWAVLATDGAYNTMTHLQLNDWPRVARADDHQLAALLDRCQAWERDEDPDGHQLPRAKRHDDKALAAVQLDRSTR